MIYNDVDHFFRPGVTSMDAVYTNLENESRNIQVIFDIPSASVNIQNFEITSSNPKATAKSADVTDAEEGCSLVINGATYKIIDVRPDGYGLTELSLKNG